jgi:hypothetical protein
VFCNFRWIRYELVSFNTDVTRNTWIRNTPFWSDVCIQYCIYEQYIYPGNKSRWTYSVIYESGSLGICVYLLYNEITSTEITNSRTNTCKTNNRKYPCHMLGWKESQCPQTVKHNDREWKIMKIKFKQWWSTIPQISTKRIIATHLS